MVCRWDLAIFMMNRDKKGGWVFIMSQEDEAVNYLYSLTLHKMYDLIFSFKPNLQRGYLSERIHCIG